MLPDDAIEIPAKRKIITFDPTIHAGHIFIAVTVLVSTTAAWCTTQARISLLEAQNNQRIIDNTYLTNIESDHHKELIKQLGDLQNDVTLILTQAGGYNAITNKR